MPADNIANLSNRIDARRRCVTMHHRYAFYLRINFQHCIQLRKRHGLKPILKQPPTLQVANFRDLREHLTEFSIADTQYFIPGRKQVSQSTLHGTPSARVNQKDVLGGSEQSFHFVNGIVQNVMKLGCTMMNHRPARRRQHSWRNTNGSRCKKREFIEFGHPSPPWSNRSVYYLQPCHHPS